MSSDPSASSVGARPPEKLNYHHEAIIDLMLAQPELSKGQIAERLGYSLPWVSVVTNSDTFLVAYRKRRAELHAGINERIVHDLSEIDKRASEKIKNELNSTDCSAEFALKAKESALDRMGYGASRNGNGRSGSPAPEAALSPEELQTARSVIHDVQQYYRRHTYEGEVVEAETREVGPEVEVSEDDPPSGEGEDYPPATDTPASEDSNGEELPEGD